MHSPVRVGRHYGNQLRLDARIVSRRHGAFLFSKDGLQYIDYNAANIKPTHSDACIIVNGDHAGTPESAALKKSVTGGARGGGGSNFTGSYSATGHVVPGTVPEPASAVGIICALTTLLARRRKARV